MDPQKTQTIEIETFVKAREIDFVLLEKPYYLAPIGKGEKVYALLREAMLAAGVIGIARVVMHTKEHLAALIPSGTALVLNTIRWAAEIRPMDGLKLPAAGSAAVGLKPAELKMAAQLISDMTAPWDSQAYADKFNEAIQTLVDKKLDAGETETVIPAEQAPAETRSSNVVDLTELLAKSLAKRTSDAAAKSGSSTGKDDSAAKARSPRKGAAKAPARKRA